MIDSFKAAPFFNDHACLFPEYCHFLLHRADSEAAFKKYIEPGLNLREELSVEFLQVAILM